MKTDKLGPAIATPTRSQAGSDILGDLVNSLPAEEGYAPADKDKFRIWKAFGGEPKRTGLERRDSVIKIAADTINNFVRGFVVYTSLPKE